MVATQTHHIVRSQSCMSNKTFVTQTCNSPFPPTPSSKGRAAYIEPELGHLGKIEALADVDQVQDILLEAAATEPCERQTREACSGLRGSDVSWKRSVLLTVGTQRNVKQLPTDQ